MVYQVSSAESTDWRASGDDQIKNNVVNLLKTRAGEIPFKRGVGINPDYIDSPAHYIEDIKGEVEELLEKFEPRATLESLTVDIGEDFVIKAVINI